MSTSAPTSPLQDGYALTFAAFLLSVGAISDRIGAVQAFAVGLGLLVVGSARYGPEPSPGALVAALLAERVGAAMVVPSSLALLRETFPGPATRARAIALWGVSSSADERRGHSAAACSSPSSGSVHRHQRGPRLLER
ncbi:MFS transporter [Streptomyces phaeochromogenes]